MFISITISNDSLIIISGLYISLSCILLINSFLLIPIRYCNLSSNDKKDILNIKFSSVTLVIDTLLGHFERHSFFVPYSLSCKGKRPGFLIGLQFVLQGNFIFV